MPTFADVSSIIVRLFPDAMSSASSTPPSPTSAAIDSAADTVTNAVRAAFAVPPGLEIDPTMTNTVADSGTTHLRRGP